VNEGEEGEVPSSSRIREEFEGSEVVEKENQREHRKERKTFSFKELAQPARLYKDSEKKLRTKEGDSATRNGKSEPILSNGEGV